MRYGRSVVGQPSPNLPWLVSLRWFALVGQASAVVIADRVLHAPVHWPLVVWLLATSLFSNGLLANGVRRRWAPLVHVDGSRQIMGLVLVFDTLLLTGLLLASGATSNPFTILYIVYIVLAALLLDTRWTGWITLLSALAFAALFVLPAPPPATAHAVHAHRPDDSHHSYSGHLSGMWIAFVGTAAVVAFFVRQITHTLAKQRDQIEELRQRASNSRHLAALTTLAAGAAHELRSPLSTIAVAAHELLRGHSRRPSNGDGTRDREDLELISAEVERCQEILWAMGADFAETLGSKDADAERIAALASKPFTDTGSAINLRVDADVGRVACHEEHAVAALRRVLSNALDAQSDRQRSPVTLHVHQQSQCVVFAVTDRGPGMDSDTLAQALTPFFTTKEPGRGMGLGLFLVNAFALSVSGELRIESTTGSGTRVELHIPRARPELVPHTAE